jgi:HSP20 family protein
MANRRLNMMKLVRCNYPTMTVNQARDFGSLPGELRGFFPGFEDFWSEPALAAFPADLYEDDANVYARFELPGYKKSEISLSLEGGVMTVNVERKAGKEGGEEVRLSRSIELAEEVVADKAAAKYEDGVLTVTIPKSSEKRARQIAIE